MGKIPDEAIDTMYAIFEKAQRYDKLAQFNKNKILHCSFCGKSQDAVNKLIAGPGIYICNECVDICKEIIGGAGEHKHEEKKELVCEQAGNVQEEQS